MTTLKYTALSLMMAKKTLGVKPNEIAYRYTWLPGMTGVYVGSDIKTNMLHSIWVGVIMTILTIPFMIFASLIMPLLKTFVGGIITIAGATFIRVTAGLMGRASGIVVDAESFESAVQESQKKEIERLMANFLDKPLDSTNPSALTLGEQLRNQLKESDQ